MRGCSWGRDLTPVPSPAGRGGNGQWDAAKENRDLSDGKVAVWGYAGVTGALVAGFKRLRRIGVTDLAFR